MQNEYYAENFNALVATCHERNAAVQTIKSIAYRPWLGDEHSRTTWYKPLEDRRDIDMAVWWVLSRPGIFLNTVGDITLLPMVLDAASRFEDAMAGTEASPGMSQKKLEEYISRLDNVPLFV